MHPLIDDRQPLRAPLFVAAPGQNLLHFRNCPISHLRHAPVKRAGHISQSGLWKGMVQCFCHHTLHNHV